MTVGLVVSIVAVVFVAWFIMMYNGLVKLRNNRENAFANIDVQLKQRYDLVPQLVNTVKGYAGHEKEILFPCCWLFSKRTWASLGSCSRFSKSLSIPASS